MKFDKLRWKYVLVISVIINIFLIISIINRAVPPNGKIFFVINSMLPLNQIIIIKTEQTHIKY